MVQRLLISGDNREAVETIRRIAEEGGLTVTTLGRGPDEDWTWEDDHAAYERQREQLGEEYAGRYIAMYRGEVVGEGDEPKAALRAGIERIGRREALFVIKAGDLIPEPEPMSMRPDAPRRVVGE